MVFVRTKTEETYEVTLFTCSTMQIQKTSEIKVSVVMTDKSQSKNSKDIETETAVMNEALQSKIVIKFLNGTRKNLAYLKFGVQVQSFNQFYTYESAFSHPLIAITNEVQYEESDGILLKATVFGNGVIIFLKKNSF